MNDEVDIANDRMMADTERAISAARQMQPPPEPTDVCLNGCGEKPIPNYRWCSKECRDDHQHREKMKKIRGGF